MKKKLSLFLLLTAVVFLFGFDLTPKFFGSWGGADQVDFPDIYIDASAGDGGVGSEADPYNEFSDINWTTGGDNSVYDYYAGTPAASVQILLKEDETWYETLVLGDVDGTATYPIIIGKYASGGVGEKPIIDRSESASGWAVASGSVYYKEFSNPPGMVLEDGVVLTDYLTWDTNVATTFSGASAPAWSSNGNYAYVLATGSVDPDTLTMRVAAETSTDVYGIYIQGNNYITIQDIKIQHTTEMGVKAQGNATYGGCTYITIKDCDFFGTGNDAISITTNQAGHDHNNNITVGGASGDGNTIEYPGLNGIAYFYGTSDSVISYNTISYGAWRGTSTAVSGHGISSWSSSDSRNMRDTIIEHNTVHHIFEANTGGEGTGIHADDYTQDCTYRYNISYSNEGSGYYDNGLSGNKWHYNVGYGNGTGTAGLFQGGLTLSSCDGTEIYNNVFYDNTPVGIGHYGTSVSYEIKNNIVFENDTYEIRYGVNGQNGLTCNYNAIYHSAGDPYMFAAGAKSWSAWTELGYDANSISADPEVINPGTDFSLQSDSPCIDEGDDVSLTEDIVGETVPTGDGVDIGAYEYPELPGAASIFYLDSDADDGGDGTTTATTGANCAWNELSDITGLSGDDFVLLQKGDTFEGVITMPNDGTSGHQITFGTYGTGASPVIDAYSTEATWVVADDVDTDNMLSNGAFTVDNDPPDDWSDAKGATLTTEGSGQDGNCLKILCDGFDNPNATQVVSATAGDVLRLTGYCKAGDEASFNFQLYDVTDGGATIWALGSTEADADWLTQRDSGSQTVPVDCVQVRVTLRQLTSASSGTYQYWDTIVLYNTEIYKKTISPAPTVVKEDGVALTYVVWNTDLNTTLNGEGSGVWTKNGTTVYVRCTDDADPDTHTMTVTGAYGINGNGKDYLTIQDLDVKNGLTANILIDGANCILTNVDSIDGEIGVSVTGASNTFKLGTITGADSEALKVTGNTFTANYSLLYTNSDDGVNISGTGGTLYNLVVYGSGGDGFDVDESCTIRNCAVRSSTGDDINIANAKTVTGGYNVIEDAAEAGAGTYTDTGTSTQFSENPDFLNAPTDFHLQSVSPCLNAGLDVSLTSDYEGNTPADPPDIGAYEYLNVSDSWYVDATTGDDSNNGVQGSPWQTLSKIGVSTFNSDDIIYLKRGETWNEKLTMSSSGTASHLIVLSAYGSTDDALPIIDGESTRDYCIDCNGKDYLDIQKVTLTDATTANILIDGTNCLFRYSKSYDGDAIGISVAGATNTLYYLKVWGNGGDGLDVNNVATIIVYNCVFYDNDIGVDVSGASASGFIMKNTVVYENTTYEVKIQSTVPDTPTINYNCVYHSALGTFMHWKGTDYDWDDWKTNSTQDGNSINEEPKLDEPT